MRIVWQRSSRFGAALSGQCLNETHRKAAPYLRNRHFLGSLPGLQREWSRKYLCS